MERWPFSGVVGRSVTHPTMRVRASVRAALMLAMLCYETVCLVSSGSEFFVRKGVPRLDLEFVLSEGIISEWNCFQMWMTFFSCL